MSKQEKFIFKMSKHIIRLNKELTSIHKEVLENLSSIHFLYYIIAS